MIPREAWSRGRWAILYNTGIDWRGILDLHEYAVYLVI
jgi:hypothetical protein